MGNQTNSQSFKGQQTLTLSCIIDEQFYLDNIKTISLKQNKQYEYYWIDPKIYNGQNQKYFKTMQTNFQIQCFTSVESLKNDLEDIDNDICIKVICAASLMDGDYAYLNSEPKISQVVLFCQNQERAKLLMSNFPKIKEAGFNIMNLISILKKFQKQETSDPILSSALFMIEEDTSIINRYRMNYSCFIKNFNRQRAKKDFVQLALQIYPQDKAKINQFAKTYDVDLKGQQSFKQVFEWAMADGKDNFFWKLLNIFPRTTIDPKKLGYLRLPFKDLYLTIYQNYQNQNIKKLKQQTYFILIDLSQIEISKLKQSLENYLIFTTFMKGYSQQSVAMKQFKNRGEKCFMFDIVFSKKKYQNDLDFGIFHNPKLSKGQDIIFNIYNFFKVDELSIKQRRGTLVYGALAELYFKRNDPITRNKITQKQECLLRNFDFAEDLSKKVVDQANLLQMSGNIRESISIYKSKIQQVRKTNVSQQILDQYALRIGDAYKMSEQFYKAQKQYLSISSSKYRAVVTVHLIELYFAMQKYEKLDKLIEEIQPKIQYLKQNGFMEESFKSQNYIGLWLMRKNKLKEANKKFKTLQAQTATYYDYKFQGIPLVHDIFRNMALCQSRMNNHSEALNLLSTTKGWQKICQGSTANLAVTERMIQSIHQTQGNKLKTQESKKQIQKINNRVKDVDTNYLKKTKILPNVNSSMVQIDL